MSAGCMQVILAKTAFIANTAQEFMGAVSLNTSSSHGVSSVILQAAHSNFTNNSAQNVGGLYAENAHVLVSNCIFRHNSAQRAGGVYLQDVMGNATLQDSSFVNNTGTPALCEVVHMLMSCTTRRYISDWHRPHVQQALVESSCMFNVTFVLHALSNMLNTLSRVVACIRHISACTLSAHNAQGDSRQQGGNPDLQPVTRALGRRGNRTKCHELLHLSPFKALLFLSAGSVIHALSDEQDMRKMGGVVQLLPFTYGMMLIGSLSLTGFPFLTGFYSKDTILELAFAHYTFYGIFYCRCIWGSHVRGGRCA